MDSKINDIINKFKLGEDLSENDIERVIDRIEILNHKKKLQIIILIEKLELQILEEMINGFCY